MELELQDALRQHEERVATMLEAHKQQVIEALTHQVRGLATGSLGEGQVVKEQEKERDREWQQSQPPQDAQNASSQPEEQSSIKSKSREWVSQGESVAEVSHYLRVGEQDARHALSHHGSVAHPDSSEGNNCYKKAHEHASAVYGSRWFELFISLTILANATTMGLYAEWSLHAVQAPTPHWYRIAVACCLCVFIVEIAIRWFTEGWHFFLSRSNNKFGWNLFDLILVLSTITDEAVEALQDSPLNVSFVRLTRFLRLIRVTRMIRVLKHFKDLRTMACGLLNCGKPLLWATLLLALMAYMYAVFLLQVTSEWLRTLPDPPSVGQQETIDFIEFHFGTLRWGMYTLMKVITGGMDWDIIADPLVEISPALLVAFCLFVLLGTMCLLNLITAVFLESAYQRSHTEDAELLHHIQDKRNWIRESRTFFHNEFEQHRPHASDCTATTAQVHEVGLAEFSEIVQKPRVRAWFEEHGLDIYFEDAKSLFELIDMDADHRIDVHEFVAALYRLKGGASSLNMQLEMQQVLAEIKAVKRSLSRLHLATLPRHVGNQRLDTDSRL